MRTVERRCERCFAPMMLDGYRMRTKYCPACARIVKTLQVRKYKAARKQRELS